MGLRSRLARIVRRFAYRIADGLAPPRDEAFRALLRTARDLLEGRVPRPSADSASPKPHMRGLIAGPELEPVEPIADDVVWSVPPISGAIKVVRSVYNTGARPPQYDIELLEQLNAEYSEKRIVPSPPSYRSDARHRTAVNRIKGAHRLIDLTNQCVLEVGCGDGFIVWLLGTDLGCDAFGVDVQERDSWQELESTSVHFFCVDMSESHPFEPNTFDRVISYAVWEHIVHPFAMLRETIDVLKPGGLALIRANLYAGPKASHRYRDIYFPWPHLLFSDEVIRDWDALHGRKPRGASWVNRMTWDQYERCFAEAGFRLRHLTFDTAQWDEDFYRRFEDVLGRFPRIDLSRDFFTVVLEKP